MKNVTYLFGAGASYPTLPVVSGFVTELLKFRKGINSTVIPPGDTWSKDGKTSLSGIQSDLTEAIDNLIDKSSVHASIDTYAKKLFIRKDERSLHELKILKIVLSLYFSWAQSIPGAHRRYDSFFASILSETADDLPNNIKIISWNYDHQFELAYQNFSGLTKLDHNQQKLGIASKFRNNNISNSKFSVFKINETASFRKESELGEIESVNPFKGNTQGLDIWLIEKYYEAIIDDTLHSDLSFAWERETGDQLQTWQLVKQRISPITEILVVVGYSFPVFNRAIDKEIIKSMVKLKRVYFQSPNPEQIISRFKSIGKVLPETQLVPVPVPEQALDDQFLLPEEIDIGLSGMRVV